MNLLKITFRYLRQTHFPHHRTEKYIFLIDGKKCSSWYYTCATMHCAKLKPPLLFIVKLFKTPFVAESTDVNAGKADAMHCSFPYPPFDVCKAVLQNKFSGIINIGGSLKHERFCVIIKFMELFASS